MKTESTIDQTPVVQRWTSARLKQVSDQFEGCSPEDVLRWGLEHFSPGLALATGFGPEGIVLMHIVSQLAPELVVFYLDTGLLFPQTYALRDELARRLGITFTRVAPDLTLDQQASAHGPSLWSHDPDRCCGLRKVEPLRRFLSTRPAWITAIRRDQTRHRANAGLIEWDQANGLVKLNPLAAWTSADVWAYLYLYELPFNPLHRQGYASIGCWPCTRPVAPGEDPRAGRWAGFDKTECGIHLQPHSPAEAA